jgi:hypothetical protein
MADNKHHPEGQDSVSTIQGHCTLHPQAKLICPVCSGTKAAGAARDVALGTRKSWIGSKDDYAFDTEKR